MVVKTRVQQITCGYSEWDIFNMNEMGLFYRTIPDKTPKKTYVEVDLPSVDKHTECVNEDDNCDEIVVELNSKP